METIRVNMTPCEDIKTIHASQNDNEGREWGFELHNNGEKIDSSSISDQLVFKAYEGGTEEILPTNGSTPTTSPFKGDIKYPQGLLSDQEFLYRESPTEEDGLAKITDIKGNTLNWNQLVQNGNFADTSLWRTYSSTEFSVSNNVGSFTVSDVSGSIYQTNTPTYVSGHKYLVIADFYVSQQSNINIEVSGTRGRIVSVKANTWYRYSDIVAPSAQGNFSLTCGQASVQVKNVMCFDLTRMGLDYITSVEEFTSLFPLPYYDYNAGTLLSFNGTGLKTVGKNRWDSTRLYGNSSSATLNNGVYTKNASGSNWLLNTESNSFGAMPVLFEANQSIVLSYKIENSTINSAFLCVAYEDGTSMNFSNAVDGFTTVLPKKIVKAGIVLYGTFTANSSKIYDIQLEVGSVATDYESYVTNTINIPVSTYFPTGMKSAGSVYDELTPAKAITRVGTRAYQSGDENDSTLTTDGTNTNYPLTTPTETSFTTASLVTENTEIPLSNEDGVLIGKCTEQLSENPGFIDAKIKLTDSDGTCYSNKLQLHVERSPQ